MSIKPEVFVGMSGGVDSSVAAYLIKKDNFPTYGVFANCFYDEDQCRNSADHKDAVKVAAHLGISLATHDYRRQYHDKVLKHFYEEYGKGVTPNPDILCNSEIKFGVMAQNVLANSPKRCLATGHYVANYQLAPDQLTSYAVASEGRGEMLKAFIPTIYSDSQSSLNFLFSSVDTSKDQSYFLYRLYANQELLNRLFFPIGEMTKAEVRRLAGEIGLNFVSSKPDSQGICFIGSVKLKDFIKDHVMANQGKVVNLNGEVIGTHSGVQFYTIGQRHGFHVKSYSEVPLYVVEKRLKENTLVVGDRSCAYVSEFKIRDLVFPYGIQKHLEKFNEAELTVRVRNLGRKIPCKVVYKNSDEYQVNLSDPEFGVAPGQSAVFYIDRLMLGGGVIFS